MGGVEPAYTFTKKHCSQERVSAHPIKELVARHGAELPEIARESINYLFEASCARRYSDHPSFEFFFDCR